MENIINYYKNPDNIKKIIPYLKDRELALIVSKGYAGENQRSTRHIRIRNERDWQWWILKWSGMVDKGTHYNFYHSMATFKGGFPDLPAKHLDRRKAIETWNRHYYDNINGYDCLIDIDSPTHDHIYTAQESTMLIAQWLDERHYKYEIRFTGCGFHIIIPFKEWKNLNCNPLVPHNIYLQMKSMVNHLHDNISEYVDTTVIDSKRVAKIPNTLAIYHNKVFICTVLNYNGLVNFKIEDYEWLKK